LKQLLKTKNDENKRKVITSLNASSFIFKKYRENISNLNDKLSENDAKLNEITLKIFTSRTTGKE